MNIYLYGKRGILRYIQNSKSDHIEFKLIVISTRKKSSILKRVSNNQAVKADIVELLGEIERLLHSFTGSKTECGIYYSSGTEK